MGQHWRAGLHWWGKVNLQALLRRPRACFQFIFISTVFTARSDGFKVLFKWGIVLYFKEPVCTGDSQEIKVTISMY